MAKKEEDSEDGQCFAEAKKFLGQHPLVVFDVGCNINMTRGDVLVDFTRLVLDSGLTIKHVHSFDPVHWQRFAERHEGESRVTVVPKALAEKQGKRTLFCPQPHGLSSFVHRPIFKTWDEPTNEVEGDCDTVDNYMKANNIDQIDYLKIDVEGGELMVLKGAEKALKEGKVMGGQFEHGAALEDAGTNLSEVRDFLAWYDYQICYMLNSNCVFKKK
jgi:FkbM family methyltransferase